MSEMETNLIGKKMPKTLTVKQLKNYKKRSKNHQKFNFSFFLITDNLAFMISSQKLLD